MASLPVGKNDRARAGFADYAGDFEPVLPGVFNASVWNIERPSPARAQNLRGIRGFLRSIFGSTARAHFSLREVEDAGSLTPLGRLQQRSAAGLFHVVTVRSDGEDVERSGRHISPDYPAQSQRSRERS